MSAKKANYLSPAPHVPETPMDLLTRMVGEKASGELIAAAGALEVHVYLQGGRIAWATSSQSPNALMRYLLEHCGLDRDSVREVVDECRKTRKPFGETLIEWKVATADQVRAALKDQISGAIQTIAGANNVNALFLPRNIDYSEKLTFEFGEIYEESREAQSWNNTVNERIARVSRALPDVIWSIASSPDGVVASGPGNLVGAGRSHVAGLAEILASERCDSITVRAVTGVLFGVQLPEPDAWYFCGANPDINLGLAKTVLAHSLGISRHSAASRAGVGTELSRRDGNLVSSMEPLIEAMQRTEDLICALIFDADSGEWQSVHRRGARASDISLTALRFGPTLFGSMVPYFPVADDLTYERISLSASAGQHLHFGTMLSESPQVGVWLVFDRTSPSGFGWALLTALARQLSSLVNR